MRFLSLLTIVLPVVVAPSRSLAENARVAQLPPQTAAIAAGTTSPSAEQRVPGAADGKAACDVSTKTEQGCTKDSAAPQGLASGGLDLAKRLNSLGVEAWERGDLAKAEQYHRQALEIRQKLAPGSLDLAESYNNLGDVEQELGHLETAEKYEHTALTI